MKGKLRKTFDITLSKNLFFFFFLIFYLEWGAARYPSLGCTPDPYVTTDTVSMCVSSPCSLWTRASLQRTQRRMFALQKI